MFKTIVTIRDNTRGEVREYSYTDRFLSFALVDALNSFAEADGFSGLTEVEITAQEVLCE